MNAKDLAAKLDGTEYPMRVDKETSDAARAAGLVIVYGASDDLMEFEGAIREELDCYGGGTAYLNETGLLVNECDCDECPHFRKIKEGAMQIKALWCKVGEYSWAYETDLPHETFEVVEDGEKYCQGLVFALADVPR